ncbi:hypothetical protein ACLUXJ_06890 [Lactobacillus porci]|uniref:hypothetical protein n=1 Tax=Lactobacillus porci TaxID=2012477 RepID=UPI00399523F5
MKYGAKEDREFAIGNRLSFCGTVLFSILLTLLVYLLSVVPSIGYIGIWASIPTGWALADLAGLYYLHKKAVKPAA